MADDSDKVLEITLPPPVLAAEDQGKPRRMSLKKLRRKQRKREARWHSKHLAELEYLIKAGIASSATLRLFARWWQLERWLRDLLQLELQAAFGPEWVRQVGSTVDRRDRNWSKNSYIPSADDLNPLAHADFGELEALIAQHWNLLSYALLPQTRWDGALDALRPIRNRLGHSRRAHTTDYERLVLVLRDITSGAQRALSAYAERSRIDDSYGDLFSRWDPTADSPDALASHAASKYNTTLRMFISRRPWAQDSASTDGNLLHLWWHSGRFPINARHLFEMSQGIPNIEQLLHLNVHSPYTVEAVLSYNSSPLYSDLTKHLFTEVLHAESPRWKGSMKEVSKWCADLDYRVRLNDYFTSASDLRGADIFHLAIEP